MPVTLPTQFGPVEAEVLCYGDVGQSWGPALTERQSPDSQNEGHQG